MFRPIVIVGILALVFGVSACGGSDPVEPAKAASVESTPTPVATPDPKEKQYALLTEAMTVMEDLMKLMDRGANSTDPDRQCNYILPKLQAKVDHIDDLVEKLEEAGMSVKDMSELRDNYSDLAGSVDSTEEVCASFGY